jgi:VIT1/CCC1 family predicted Fe2+/Mn2+ transporter
LCPRYFKTDAILIATLLRFWLLIAAVSPQARLIPFVSVSSLAVLALMGGLAARAGGARVIMGAIRVTFWGGLAMAMTSGIGWLVGAIA